MTTTPLQRQRRTRPEQVMLTIERVEHLTIEISRAAIPAGANPVGVKVNGAEQRLDIVEEALRLSNGRAGIVEPLCNRAGAPEA